MNWQNYRWSIVGLTIIVTLAVLFGGQFLWQQLAIAKPMSQIAQGIDGVESAFLEKNSQNDSTVKINVTLAHVTNLQTTYKALNDRIFNVLGHKKYKIIINDSRTPELEQLYYSIHYYIQEAIFTGNFGLMSEKIQSKATASGSNAQVFVDAKYVYLQLSSQNSNMYIVVPRQPELEVK